MNPRTKRIWKIVASIVAALALAYIGLTIWSFVALHRAYAALARDGRPMTAAEVIPPPVAAKDNAAPLCEEATRLLKSDKVGDDTLLLALGLAAHDAAATNATSADVTRFRELVMRPAAQHALELVVQAGERKACRFDLNYTSASWIACTNISDLITLSKVVRGEVRRLTDVGEYSNAWRMAIAVLELAKSKREEPYIISQLLTIALDAIADASLRRLCAADLPSQENYGRIIAALTQMDRPTEFQRMLDGERLLCGDRGFEPMTMEGVGALLTIVEVPRWKQYVYLCVWQPLARLDHAAYLRVFRGAATTPLSRPLPPFHVSRHYFFTCSLLPALESCRTHFIADLTRIRCTEAGVSVLAYKKAHGTWPESLAACMKQVPIDPFCEKPLRYRVTEKGFVVSSVGTVLNSNKAIAWEYEPENLR